MPFWRFFANRLPMVRNARRRRSQWDGRAEALARYSARPSSKVGRQGCLRIIWRTASLGRRQACGFLASRNGRRRRFGPKPAILGEPSRALTMKFRCAGRNRRQFYAHCAGADKRLEKLGVKVAKVPGVSHLLPMEKPALAADFILGTGIMRPNLPRAPICRVG